jgi:hypothetical protein
MQGSPPNLWFNTFEHVKVPFAYTLMDNDVLAIFKAIAFAQDPWHLVSSLGDLVVERFLPPAYTFQAKEFYQNRRVLQLHYQMAVHVMDNYVLCSRITKPVFTELGLMMTSMRPQALATWLLQLQQQQQQTSAICFAFFCKICTSHRKSAWTVSAHIGVPPGQADRRENFTVWKFWSLATDTYHALIKYAVHLKETYTCIATSRRARAKRSRADLSFTTIAQLVDAHTCNHPLITPVASFLRTSTFARAFAYELVLRTFSVSDGGECVILTRKKEEHKKQKRVFMIDVNQQESAINNGL